LKRLRYSPELSQPLPPARRQQRRARSDAARRLRVLQRNEGFWR